MTVKELIKALIDMPLNAEVGVCVYDIFKREHEGEAVEVKEWNPFFVEIVGERKEE